jgi:hypothetical protein
MVLGRTFDLLAVVTASTKRRPDPVGGIVGDAVTNIDSLSCTPLDPVDPDLRDMIPGLSGKGELRQTLIEGGLDIKEGDILVVGSASYSIRAVGDWYWRPDESDFVHLFLEEHK